MLRVRKNLWAAAGFAAAFMFISAGGRIIRTQAAEFESHTHSYESTVVAPTCETQGYTLYACACGDSYKDSYVDALRHNYYFVDTGSGTHRAVCQNDAGHSLEEGHEWTFVNKILPGCSEEGYTLYTCGKCGAEQKREYTESKGHDYSWIDNANGSHTGICSRNKNHVVSEYCNEFYKDYITPPTCDEQGYTSHICGRCGYVLVDAYTPASGHEYEYTDNGDGTHTGVCRHDGTHIVNRSHAMKETQIPPSCEERGYNRHECTDCGYTFLDDYTPWKGHEWKFIPNHNGTHRAVCERDPAHCKEENCTYTEKTVAPTDSSQGYTVHTCDSCGYSYQDTFLPEKGHNFKWDWNDDGTHTGRCADCDEEITERCTYTSEVVEPSCTEDGYVKHTCKVCGRTYKDNYREHTGHSYEWTSLRDGRHSGVCKNNADHKVTEACSYEEIVTAPTCEKDGFTVHCCRVCDYEYKDAPVDRLGHDYIYEDLGDGTHRMTCRNNPDEAELIRLHTYTECTVKAGCTEEGYTHYECRHCGAGYKDGIVSAKGHNYVWNAVDNINHKAVCLNDSSHTFAAVHDASETVTKPTCTADGYTTYRCRICGHMWKDNIVKATAHNYVWVTDQAADAGVAGSGHEQCSSCGNKKEAVSIPALKSEILLPVVSAKNTSQTIRWDAIPGADGYVIYGNRCGGRMRRLKQVKGTKWTRKKLKKGVYYKYYVVAVKEKDGVKTDIQKSLTVHSTTKGGSGANPSRVKLLKKKLIIGEYKNAKGFAKVFDARVKRHVKNLRYISSDKAIASVNKKGRISAKKKGSCKIYVIAQDGRYKAVKVKVK